MPTLKQIASLIDGEIIGDPMIDISGVSEIQNGKSGTITFLGNSKYQKYLSDTSASAIISNNESILEGKNGIIVQNPTLAISKVLELFFPKKKPIVGIHSNASIHENATIGNNVTIDAGVVIEDGAIIKDDVWIGSNSVVGQNTIVGQNSRLYANVTLYHNITIGERAIIHSGAVIGSDGFGFTVENGNNYKIHHTGNVVVGNDVEIGASTTIDRGTIGDTTLNDDVKLDNQVQIAHNVKLGKGCRISGGSCIGGSTELGENVIAGGMVEFINSLVIGSNSAFAGASIVTKSLPGNQIYAGNPAREIKSQHKRDATIAEIARIKKQLDKLQNQVKNN